MKIALSQMNTRAGNFASTVDRMVVQSRIAADKDVDLLVFPTTALTGPTVGYISQTEEYMTDLIGSLWDLRERLATPALIPLALGIPNGPEFELVYFDGTDVMPLLMLNNAMSVITTMDAADFEGPFEFEIQGHSAAVAFTQNDLADLREENTTYDLVFYLPCENFSIDDEASVLAPAANTGSFTKEVEKMSCWLVAVGGVGGYDEQVFAGGSFVMAPWGELLLAMPNFEEDFQTAEIKFDEKGPLAAPAEVEPFNRASLLWQALSAATRAYLTHDGVRRDVVVALDGTLASSLVAVLATDAVGPTLVHGLIIDTKDPAALSDARTLARNIRIDAEELSASQAASAAHALGAPMDAPYMRAVMARCRLAALAAERQAIVLSTQDKTGFALELADDELTPALFAPFGDVYRMDVIKLAAYRNTISAVIPDAALARIAVPKVAGAGFGGDTPLEQINTIDSILLSHIEFGLGMEPIVYRGTNMLLVEAVFEQMIVTELARRATPASPIVSSCTLAEASVPVDFAWRDRLRSYKDRLAVENFTRNVNALIAKKSESPRESLERRARELHTMLRDIAETGALDEHDDSDDDGPADVWDTGLFSDN